METELYKRLERFEARRSGDPERPTNSYTDEELHVMIKGGLARYRYGLPGR
jgi:hypothetical protein